jgi:hypothetical protein
MSRRSSHHQRRRHHEYRSTLRCCLSHGLCGDRVLNHRGTFCLGCGQPADWVIVVKVAPFLTRRITRSCPLSAITTGRTSHLSEQIALESRCFPESSMRSWQEPLRAYSRHAAHLMTPTSHRVRQIQRQCPPVARAGLPDFLPRTPRTIPRRPNDGSSGFAPPCHPVEPRHFRPRGHQSARLRTLPQ